jgi:hypothetical protein
VVVRNPINTLFTNALTMRDAKNRRESAVSSARVISIRDRRRAHDALHFKRSSCCAVTQYKILRVTFGSLR